jgi:hypothetical protein
MSGYPNDRFADNPSNLDWLNDAHVAVRLPATLLIVIGMLSLLLATLLLIQLDSIPDKLDQIIAEISANPQLAKEDKDKQIDFFTAVKDSIETHRTAFVTYYAINIACSILVVIGGINMLRLSGPAIPIISCVIAILPGALVWCCCFGGFPVGIWALVVLNRPDIRAAMAQRPIDENPDDPDPN